MASPAETGDLPSGSVPAVRLQPFTRVLVTACSALICFSALAAAPATTQSTNLSLPPPFSTHGVVHGESALFLAPSDGPAEAALLLRPKAVRAVRNRLTGETYTEGRDYRVDADRRRLVRLDGSRLPFLHESDLYKKPHEPHAAAHKVGDENTWLLWDEDGFAAKQVEVDYDAAEPWDGYVPHSAAAALPRTFARLRHHEHLSIAVSGDSISAGYNSSARHNTPPYQGAYPALLAAALEKTYGSKVDLLNVSVAGLRADSAMASLPRVLEVEPDLVVVAYGMNDVGRRDPALYARQIQTFIDAVRAKRPDAEFILVTTSLGNPDWTAIPADQFPKYRDALADLCSDERHVALADVTQLWTDLLRRKRYADLTGNGLNHPNDFGHRLYAQTLMQLLTPPIER